MKVIHVGSKRCNSASLKGKCSRFRSDPVPNQWFKRGSWLFVNDDATQCTTVIGFGWHRVTVVGRCAGPPCSVRVQKSFCIQMLRDCTQRTRRFSDRALLKQFSHSTLLAGRSVWRKDLCGLHSPEELLAADVFHLLPGWALRSKILPFFFSIFCCLIS